MLAGYSGLMVYHALAGKRETKGVTDYYIGGRSMGGALVRLHRMVYHPDTLTSVCEKSSPTKSSGSSRAIDRA